MQGSFRPRGLWLAGGVTLVLAGLVVAVLVSRSGDGRRASARVTHAAYAHRAVEVEGREGGEGDREQNKGEGGTKTPWGEQVANRAYPRNYVDDRRVLSERRAFDRLPSQAPRSAFRTQRAFDLAAASSPVKWASLGPVTPNVAGEASQFFDPATLQGPPTQSPGA